MNPAHLPSSSYNITPYQPTNQENAEVPSFLTQDTPTTPCLANLDQGSTSIHRSKNRLLLNAIAHRLHPSFVSNAITRNQSTISQSTAAQMLPPQPTIQYTPAYLRGILGDAGYVSNNIIKDVTVIARLQSMGATLDTIVATARIGMDLHHPILNNEIKPERNAYQILRTLIQIFNKTQLNIRAFQAIKNGENNPEKIATNIIYAVPY